MAKAYTPRQYVSAAEWLEAKADKVAATRKTDSGRSLNLHLRQIAGMLRQAVESVVKPDLFGAEVTEAKCQIDEIVCLWNRMALPPVPKVQRVMGSLRKKISARLKAFPAVETFRLVFQFLNNSPWHRGEDPKSTGWVVTLAWVVKSDEIFQRLAEKAVASRPERTTVPGCRHRIPCSNPVECTRILLTEN